MRKTLPRGQTVAGDRRKFIHKASDSKYFNNKEGGEDIRVNGTQNKSNHRSTDIRLDQAVATIYNN